MKFLIRFFKDDSGATAIEYALIAAGISMAILAAVKVPGGATFCALPSALIYLIA